MKKLMSYIITVILALCSVPLISCGGSPMETVTTYGEFCTLQEAYNSGLMSFEDFDYIEDNENSPEKFTALSDVDREKIIHDYKALHIEASDDIDIKNYGNYNGCIVVHVTDNYYGNAFEKIPDQWHYVVQNLKNGNSKTCPAHFVWLSVWKEHSEPKQVEKPKMPNGVFVSFNRAYELGFVSEDEIKSVWNSDKLASWESVRVKIKSDYLTLGIERDCYNAKIYGRNNVNIPHKYTYEDYVDFVSVEYVGNIRNFVAVRLCDMMHVDGFNEYYDFDIGGYTYRDRFPLACLWIPSDKLDSVK